VKLQNLGSSINMRSSLDRREFFKQAGINALCIGGAFSLFSSGSCAPGDETPTPEENKQPNFIFILVDDMGWSDSSTFGSRFYDTPNLTRMANEGMRFTNAYAASPVCSPTRASILTGRYPGRLRLTSTVSWKDGLDNPGILKDIPPCFKVRPSETPSCLALKEHTIAEALKAGGYSTCFIGKWHLGKKGALPEDQGFDKSVALTDRAGAPSYFSPYGLENLEDGPKGEYLTDRLVDETIRYLDNRNTEKPFALFLWHYAIHGPFQAKEEIIEQYKQKVDPNYKHRNPLYAAMLKSVDEGLGRLLDNLDKLGLDENTAVIFFSDNGGGVHNIRHGYMTSNAPLRGRKLTLYEGGVRVPII